jgi:hypothetical protein
MSEKNEFQPLMDEIFRDKVLRARQKTPERKFVLGLELFEESLVRMRGGIRAQFPHFTEEEVEQELYRRIKRVRQMQQHGFYSSAPP